MKFLYRTLLLSCSIVSYFSREIGINSDGTTTTSEIRLKELQEILKNAGRNIKLAERILNEFDTDESDGLSTAEYNQFLQGRKHPNKFRRRQPNNKKTTRTKKTKKTKKTKSHSPSKKVIKTSKASREQQLRERFQAAQSKMQESFQSFSQGNMGGFVSAATTAISEAQHVIKSLSLTKYDKRNKKTNKIQYKTYEQWIVQIFATTTKYLHAVADQTSNRQFLQQALVLQNQLLLHLKKGTQVHLDALIEASQLQVETANFCKGIDLLNEYTSYMDTNEKDPEGYRQALDSLPERSLQQYTLGSHNCNVTQSHLLFDHIFSMNYLSPLKPNVCVKCWGIYGIVLRALNRSDEYTTYFQTQLKKKVAWMHPHQLPSKFNLKLATEIPETIWINKEMKNNQNNIITNTNVDLGGKYSKRRRSNVAVMIVRVIFISSFLFYCLLLNHSFPTNPNKITNCFKLILSIYNFTIYICSMRFVYF